MLITLRSIMVPGLNSCAKRKRFTVLGLKPISTTDVKTNISPAFNTSQQVRMRTTAVSSRYERDEIDSDVRLRGELIRCRFNARNGSDRSEVIFRTGLI